MKTTCSEFLCVTQREIGEIRYVSAAPIDSSIYFIIYITRIQHCVFNNNKKKLNDVNSSYDLC